MSEKGTVLTLVPLTAAPPTTPPQPATELTVPQEVTALVSRVKGFVIKDADLNLEAKRLLLDMKKIKATVEQGRDAEVAPIQETLDREAAPYVKEIARIKNKAGLAIKLLSDNISTLTHLIFDFEERERKAAQKRQQIENQKFAEKVATQQAEAIASGAPMKALPPVKVVAQPAKTEKFDDGSSLTIAVDQDFTIPGVADKEKLSRDDQRGKDIPSRFFNLDWTALRKVVRAGGGDLIKGIVLVKKPKSIGRTSEDSE